MPAQVAIRVTCVCGAVKGETNHWWYISRQMRGHGGTPLHSALLVVGLDEEEIRRAAEMGPVYPNTIVCGEACAAKELSKWMQQQKEQSQNG